MTKARHPAGDELRTLYSELARRYDLLMALPEALLLRRLRRRLLARAAGDTLEVAAGTGANFRHYPDGCRLTALEMTPEMLRIGRRRAARRGRAVRFLRGDSQSLPFPDAAFDTVVDSLTLCSYLDPLGALREMSRVCRPEGRILLLEHGRSRVGWIARWQERSAPGHLAKYGCHLTREPRRLVEEAGLRVRDAARSFSGIFHTIEAGRR